MTTPSNITSIEQATSRSWKWIALLNAHGAAELDHKKVVELVADELADKLENPGWWAQSVTVAYEQHIGRREPGQQNDGTYELSVTKTLPGTKEDVMKLWLDVYGQATKFGELGVSRVRSSATPVRIYWRCNLDDGSKLIVASEQKSKGKAMVSITHVNLSSNQASDQWRSFWKQSLEGL